MFRSKENFVKECELKVSLSKEFEGTNFHTCRYLNRVDNQNNGRIEVAGCKLLQMNRSIFSGFYIGKTSNNACFRKFFSFDSH